MSFFPATVSKYLFYSVPPTTFNFILFFCKEFQVIFFSLLDPRPITQTNMGNFEHGIFRYFKAAALTLAWWAFWGGVLACKGVCGVTMGE